MDESGLIRAQGKALKPVRRWLCLTPGCLRNDGDVCTLAGCPGMRRAVEKTRSMIEAAFKEG